MIVKDALGDTSPKMYLDTENNTPSEVYIMRKACLFAFTTLLLSCGGDTPTEPKKDYYCSENYKTYETSDAYYFECPSMWCPYSNTYMTVFYFQDHCTKENLQRSSSSQVAPSSSSIPVRSSSSVRPASSSSACPTTKCECNPIYLKTYETMAGSFGGADPSYTIAQQVGCTL